MPAEVIKNQRITVDQTASNISADTLPGVEMSAEDRRLQSIRYDANALSNVLYKPDRPEHRLVVLNCRQEVLDHLLKEDEYYSDKNRNINIETDVNRTRGPIDNVLSTELTNPPQELRKNLINLTPKLTENGTYILAIIVSQGQFGSDPALAQLGEKDVYVYPKGYIDDIFNTIRNKLNVRLNVELPLQGVGVAPVTCIIKKEHSPNQKLFSVTDDEKDNVLKPGGRKAYPRKDLAIAHSLKDKNDNILINLTDEGKLRLIYTDKEKFDNLKTHGAMHEFSYNVFSCDPARPNGELEWSPNDDAKSERNKSVKNVVEELLRQGAELHLVDEDTYEKFKNAENDTERHAVLSTYRVTRENEVRERAYQKSLEEGSHEHGHGNEHGHEEHADHEEHEKKKKHWSDKFKNVFKKLFHRKSAHS